MGVWLVREDDWRCWVCGRFSLFEVEVRGKFAWMSCFGSSVSLERVGEGGWLKCCVWVCFPWLRLREVGDWWFGCLLLWRWILAFGYRCAFREKAGVG